MRLLRPDAVLALGDNQYEDGAYDKFVRSFGPTWGRFKSLIRPAVGNHEYETANAAGYCRYFGTAAHCDHGLYYSFELGAWHLIVLNSECSFVGGCGKGSRQEAWLKQDLQAHANVCTLAYWHRPRWTSGRHTGSVAMTALWNDLVAAHADVVLNGHNHVYERFGPLGASGQRAPDGVREFVVGTGGASRYPFTDPPRPGEEVRSADSFGVIQLTLRPTSYSWRFVSIAGTFSDSGASRCQQ